MLKVYYLDDEPDLLEIFQDTFSDENIQISTFTDPAEALKAIQTAPPDLLFIDYRLPNTTGETFARKIDPSIPKALITGDLSTKAGEMFQALFSKPFRRAQIETFIRGYLNSKKAA